MENLPTPEEMDAARVACGPTAPIPILMGWVMGQRRDRIAEDFTASVHRMAGRDVNDQS